MMDFTQLAAPAAAVVTAILSYLSARRMIANERAKEAARQQEKSRADEARFERMLAALGDRAREAVTAERDQLLGRWQQALDEAFDERRRLVEDHRVEIARVRKHSDWEVERVKRESAAIIAQLRAQFAERLADQAPGSERSADDS